MRILNKQYIFNLIIELVTKYNTNFHAAATSLGFTSVQCQKCHEFFDGWTFSFMMFWKDNHN